jgi:hypothetical protein
MGMTNMAVDSDGRVIAEEDEYTYLLDISQQPPQILCVIEVYVNLVHLTILLVNIRLKIPTL